MLAEIFQKARLLIVDDEPANISVLTQMLKAQQAPHIASTTNPREVLNLFHSFQPDIILLDLMMPDMDGFEVMAQLDPLIAPDDFLPILILTADSTLATRRRALDGGANDFLTKPFDATELMLRIHNLLRTRVLHQALKDQNLVLDQRVQRRTSDLARAQLETLQRLALAAEYRDDDTGLHTKRVGQMSAQIASSLGQTPEQTDLILRAAPLHDVGKIGISDTILLKPGKLTDEEFATMKQHTEIGAGILAGSTSPWLQLAEVIALSHHERWDGRGYPQQLSGEEIPLVGRIVAVADVFDALTHERPYKRAWPIAEAVDEIHKQAGHQFDPQVVEAFLTLTHEMLELSTV